MYSIIKSIPVIVVSSLFFITTTLTSASQSLAVEIADSKNPSWQKVPGSTTYDENQELTTAAININGITRKGNILTFDVVNPNSAYERIQTNCKTGKIRSIRQGDFQSSTRVSYTIFISSWEKPTSTYNRALVKFVCNL